MSKVLDLAVELPVYQRSVLYAYNSDVISEKTIPTDINPYSSPLDRIWEIEFANSDDVADAGDDALDNAVVAIINTKPEDFTTTKSKNSTEDGQ